MRSFSTDLLLLVVAGCAAQVGKPAVEAPLFAEADEPADGFTRRLQLRTELDMANPIHAEFAPEGRYAGYLFSATRGSEVAIDVVSTDADPVVYLYGPARSERWSRHSPIATDDDGGDGLNSHLTRSITRDGVYLVLVREYSNQAGSFTLTLSCAGDHCDRPLCGNEGQVCPAQSTCRYLRCALPCHSYCEPTFPNVCDPIDCGPAPGLPNSLCSDGSTAGPTGRCVRNDEGVCGWEITSCPPPVACGSRGMAPCAEGQFCNFAEEASCGATDRPGTCTAIPSRCTREFFPTCGCDGSTYSNACTANAHGVSVAHAGACAE